VPDRSHRWLSDLFRTHGRLTKADIAADIEAAPELQAYIDLRRFTATVRGRSCAD
jgi:hypothetical protein